MTKLVLVIAGDQFAADIAGVDAGNYLASKTGEAVKVINVTVPQKITSYTYAKRPSRQYESGPEVGLEWYEPKGCAATYVASLSQYAQSVANALPSEEWTPAGVWWFLGVSDARLLASGDLAAGTLQSDIQTLLAWNPFGTGTPVNFIGAVPTFPFYSPPPGLLTATNTSQCLSGNNLTALNNAISGAVTASSGGAVLVSGTGELSGWEDLRKVEKTKDYGLSTAGARKAAGLFAGVTSENLGISGDGGTPTTETVRKPVYTTHTRTVTRNKLSGLEGRTVTALIDGEAYPDLQVGADGTLVLPKAGNKITVGLPYTSVLAPMPLESDSGKDGSTLGKRRAYGRCAVRVYRSRGGQYGASTPNDLYDVDSWVQTRQAPNQMALYDIPYALFRDDQYPFSGDIEFSLPSGQDADTTIWIVQDKPWPLRIVSIMVDVDFGQQ